MRLAFSTVLPSLLAAVVMAAAAEAQAITPVRISIKRIWGGTSGLATVSAPHADWDPYNPTLSGNALINSIVAGASAILTGPVGSTGARISLQYNPATDLIDIYDPGYPFSFYDVVLGPPAGGLSFKDAMEAAAEADPARYGYRPDAINIYLVNSINSGGGASFGGFCSFPIGAGTPSTFPDEDDLIFMAGQTGFANPTEQLDFYASTLAHEIGHYFSLIHTFNTQAFGVATGGPTGPEGIPACGGTALGCGTTGDVVCDTPNDPWIDQTLGVGPLNGQYGAGGTFPCAAFLALLQQNAMAQYYTLLSLVPLASMSLTPGQRARMNVPLTTSRARVTAASVPPTITSSGPNVISYESQPLGGGSVTLTLTGTGFATLPAGVIDVTLGRLVCTNVAAPTCTPEAVSGIVVVDSNTSLRAKFTAPLPPGRHNLVLRVNQQALAFLDDGLEMLPYIDSDMVRPYDVNAPAPAPPINELGTATVRTTPAFDPFFIGIELTPPGPIVFPTPAVQTGVLYTLLLNIANPIITTALPPGVPIQTGPTGVYTVGFDLATTPNRALTYSQASPFNPVNVLGGSFLLLTNVMPIVAP